MTIPLIQATAMKTVLKIAFPNGRVVGILINPIETKMGALPDGELYTEVTATTVGDAPIVPFGLTVIPVGGKFQSPDQPIEVARFEVSPTESDVIIRHTDGSSETVRFQHAPNVQGVATKIPAVGVTTHD